MKKKILVLSQYYLPGYLAGGPIRSICNILDWFKDDFEWYVLTTDRDLNSESAYAGVEINKWIYLNGVRVYYIKSGDGFWRVAEQIRRINPDLLYINSFFSPVFSCIPVFLRKIGIIQPVRILIAPRGEFSSGAIGLKKYKKKFYIFVAKLLRLYDFKWHASTDLEANDILRVVGKNDEIFVARVFVARDMSAPLVGPRKGGSMLLERRQLNICFLSRIAPMKNLIFALMVLRKIPHEVLFHIYGPAEDEAYCNQCASMIEAMPQNIKCVFLGAVAHENVKATIASYDLFFLPTLGENFGHALLEAWASGVPVLTSDRTPWRNLAELGVGWDLDLADPDCFVDVINEVAVWSDHKREIVSRKCLEFAKINIEDKKVYDDNRTMFLSSLGV